MSLAVYEKLSFFGTNTIDFLLLCLLGYSSKVGLIKPIFPSIFSMTDFISSAAPFPTTIFSFFISKILATRLELTLSPEGYCSRSTLKLYFNSSIIFLGGKYGFTK